MESAILWETMVNAFVLAAAIATIADVFRHW
jgi:hypothetical protein